MPTEATPALERTARPASTARAVVATVAYADVFDFPLTLAELHRYLIGTAASLAEVRALLDEAPEARGCLTQRDGFVLLRGREAIVATRRRRAAVAQRLWPRALRYGRAIAALPFVRMVALTGALAVDNVEDGADIDYLVVTEPGRLWLCRLLAIALVRAVALRGDVICPNYFLAATALALDDRGLYAAHELAQMVPIAGIATYCHMRRLNVWADGLLPNAAGPPRAVLAEPGPRRARALVEAALRTPVGARIERWEMARKVRKLTRQGVNPETAFSPAYCKGHFDGHGRRVMAAYAERLQSVGLWQGQGELCAP
ncbi:MAG TPA: hypothetical protein VNL77_04690 [Roseiflexaceae bacterium]|nr:hypothetical protein [Roseiflexaceae bacterium]